MVYEVPFSVDSHEIVQTFDCGQKRWEQGVNVWIKSVPDDKNDCALKAISGPSPACRVWLYSSEPRLTKDTLVGYASLGTSNWRFPPKPREEVGIIPFFGVDLRFRGKKNEEGVSYGQEIFEYLLGHAFDLSTLINKLGLFVDPLNIDGKKFWSKVGFEYHPTKTYTEDGVVYPAMFMNFR